MVDKPLPLPVQDLIISYFDGDIGVNEEKIYNANHSCALFQGGSKEKPKDRLALIALLRHVARGEQNQAEAIIQAHPQLLFETAHTMDQAGNKFINFSPIRLACYTHDAAMIKMMEPYLNQVENGKQKYAAILKEANDARKEQKPYDFSQIVTAITNDNAEQIKESIDLFKRHLAPKDIINEKSFNDTTLCEAYQVYVRNYEGWSEDQCDLFWKQVIGYCQRQLPSWYAQAICQGLYHTTEGNQPLKRGLTINSNQSYYPDDIHKPKGLGFDSAIYSYHMVDNWMRLAPGPGSVAFEKLCEKNTNELEELAREAENQLQVEKICDAKGLKRK